MPSIENGACFGRVVPSRQPVWESGVAQIFTNPCDRSAALSHKRYGHYYARNSHPTLESLGGFIKNSIVESEYISFTESGLSACIVALKSLVPLNGSIVYDSRIYYEVERELIFMAGQFNWELIKIDFLDIERIQQRVDEYLQIDVFFCDSPRNWWLDSLDIQSLSSVVKSKGASFIVDTSVQPVQNVLKDGADLIVMSLSKYPSLGLTLGGAILCNDTNLIKRCQITSGKEGHVLSPDSAATIWSQILSLKDRMMAISMKAEDIVEFLKSHNAVTKVRFPNKDRCGGLIGGQISFHVKEPKIGHLMEEIIGQNSLSMKMPLHLACTFGASFTTFEHFASNVRHRSGIPREATNEVDIPYDIIRIGIGCEDKDDIIMELDFLLSLATSYFNSK